MTVYRIFDLFSMFIRELTSGISFVESIGYTRYLAVRFQQRLRTDGVAHGTIIYKGKIGRRSTINESDSDCVRNWMSIPDNTSEKKP
uniref:Uncharacterized protein n=1 Tax=Rhizophagus irregularis (strain DAOM 181602 / DAOM 197198 / MUCL 43194) TaxID=747089 RepID=U9SWE9_RHIID